MLKLEEFSKSNKLFDGHYKLIRPLSTEGGTADVWLAIDTITIDSYKGEADNGLTAIKDENTGMYVAIKIYRPKNALDIEGEQRFRDEYKIVYECRHANLLQPTSFSIFEDTPYLVLPYCKYGSSEQLIGKTIPVEEIWKIILDVASGLNRLHTNDPQIIHQDIKPANILIDNNNNYTITDFGISSKRGSVHGIYYDEENSGTLAYMAPERFQEGTKPLTQSDIWAFGATLCEILTGNVPFGEDGGFGQLSKNLPMPSIPNAPADIQRLIHACLSPKPEDRPTAAEIKVSAMARQYPTKSGKWILPVCSLLAVLIVSVAAYFIFRPAIVTNEEKYESALLKMNDDNVDILRIGMAEMEVLCKQNYVPALYQMAFTYGWYSDSLSLKRKELLGIDIIEEGDEKCMPRNYEYNRTAIKLLQMIVDMKDSSFAYFNGQAAYRLACYYFNKNKIYQNSAENVENAKLLLESSFEWAKIANDTILLPEIINGLTFFETE